jgi:purine-binding chemotaxis protein CheW
MPDEEDITDKEERQIVIFRLGDEEFGVNINEVRDIIRMDQVTKIPNTKPFIEGVINLRGSIIVVIDLAMKLGLPTKEPDKNTRIINIEMDDSIVGMIVDRATEVMRLSPEMIEPAPPIITQKIDADYIDGVGIVGDRLLILLDLTKVIGEEDMAHLQSAEEMAPKPQEGQEGQESQEVKQEGEQGPQVVHDESPHPQEGEKPSAEEEAKPDEKPKESTEPASLKDMLG